MTKDVLEKITQQLSGLVGESVKEVVAGYGSFFQIKFGELIDIKYPNGRMRSRREWIIWLYFCAWRVELQEQVICSANSSREVIDTQAAALVDCELTDVKLDPKTLELELIFDKQWRVRTFVDCLDDEQWIFFRPHDQSVTALANGSFVVED